MLPQLIKLRGAALDLLFPQYCVGCGKEGAYICPQCRSNLPYILTPVCPKCGELNGNGNICESCLHNHKEIDCICAPFRFEGVIRDAVHQLKYRNLKAIAPALANFLRDYFTMQSFHADVLVPVPLHARRLRERGYNQSALLADGLGRLLGIPVNEKLLKRTRHSLPQARTATVVERRRNVIDLFECNDTSVTDKTIVIIDDVTTSGATLYSCALTLKRAGALSVQGLALAKEI